MSSLIPWSVREVIRTQLGQLTPAAWAFLVAGAVLGQGLTFERLCQVAQIDELAGLHALEELLREGLLYENTLTEEALELNEYRFPREILRKVVYLEAGAARQRIVQQRVAGIVQEEVSRRAITLNRAGLQEGDLVHAL